ncbi:MAG: hypothetical protein LUQ38_12345 [Methanotrichaceae archaeon]|nr:hypothetical protein [Methanotrichaceae archaeon]MDD1758030.1 hypothetical protein [Methanotrichaceae archaeon]
MPTSSRIEISDKALKVLKMEAALRGFNQRDTLEMLICGNASPEIMALIDRIPSKGRVIVDILPAEMPEKSERAERPEMRVHRSSRKPKLAKDPETIKTKIKEAWNRTPRPTYREMAKEFGCAGSTISKYVLQLKESGEL